MCSILHLPDGSEVATFGDLRELMAEEPPIDRRYGYQDDLPDHSCICPVDLDACALVMGWSLTWKDGDAYAHAAVP